ncbi:MAG: ribulose-phosphate 3-epimerase, partial [Thermoprotei archaeon]
ARLLINLSREIGFKCGFAIKPSTPEPPWLEAVLDKAHFILPMSVEPGFPGQKFIRSIIPRFKKLSTLREQNAYPFELEADGGVNHENAPELVENGVDILVAGSSIFSSEDIKQATQRLRFACGVYTA